MNALIEHGMKVSPERYHHALREQEAIAGEMDVFMQGYDVLISLSTAGEAPLREIVEKPDAGLMWTLMQLPLISAPVFRSPSGLPFGLQIVARRYNDYLLYRFCDFLLQAGMIPKRSSFL